MREDGSHAPAMAVDIVPFQLIRRVCIRPRRAEPGAVGFSHCHAPEVIRAETLLNAVMPAEHDRAS